MKYRTIDDTFINLVSCADLNRNGNHWRAVAPGRPAASGYSVGSLSTSGNFIRAVLRGADEPPSKPNGTLPEGAIKAGGVTAPRHAPDGFAAYRQQLVGSSFRGASTAGASAGFGAPRHRAGRPGMAMPARLAPGRSERGPSPRERAPVAAVAAMEPRPRRGYIGVPGKPGAHYARTS